MGKINVKNFDDIKGRLIKLDAFWKNPCGISRWIEKSVNDSALQEIRLVGRNEYQVNLGEDNMHMISPNQDIQFYSELSKKNFKDVDYVQGCYFANKETLAFSMLKKDDDTTIIKYSRAKENENGFHNATRGVEVYKGNNFYCIENKVSSINGNIKSISSDIKYSTDGINIVDAKTYYTMHNECHSWRALKGEIENPSNLLSFNEYVLENANNSQFYKTSCGKTELIDETTAEGHHEAYQIAFNAHDIKHLEEFQPEALKSQDSALQDHEQ